MLFLASSFSVAVQTKSDRTTDETSLLDNICFDELSKYENTMNHSISETTESNQ